MTAWTRNPASFRDPSGFVFTQDGVLYRQVNESFAPNYDRLKRSGLYTELTELGLMVEHDEVELRPDGAPPAHVVLRPRPVPFISYPYEWCFGQLKAAALLTLELQRRAIARGLVLRDASAYNIQFLDARPALIDTLSFGALVEGEPWSAYRQFCQHFVAPLALMAHADGSLGQLLRVHIDGIPLDLAASLLPFSTRFRPGLLTHLHLHARSIVRRSKLPVAAGAETASHRRMSRSALLGLADSLESTVRGLAWEPARSVWADYYANTNYTPGAERNKQQLVSRYIETAGARGRLSIVWDLGANTGAYSLIAAAAGAHVVSLDMDHLAVERHYRDCVSRGETRILPLVQDLTNPSGGIGWRNAERRSLAERGPADLALALALIHHLAIANNLSLDEIASFLRSIARTLIIEFVPKDDSQVRRMLAVRPDIFPDYHQGAFEAAFQREFDILNRESIGESSRTLYLMEAR